MHPVLGADGVWTTPLDLTAGQLAAVRRLRPEPPTARTTSSAPTSPSPAPSRPLPCPPPAATAEVDGYTVVLNGALDAGAESELQLSVSRDGVPVTDLQPYLGAYGHLVVLRAGDLAYLHVHPLGEPGDPSVAPGPHVEFATTAPSAGTYRLFLDFRHGDVVRTAAFTVEVPVVTATAGDVELLIGGMTCASCAARIEKKLNKLDGVTATVNYATEKAKVSFGEGVTPADLIATVEKTGYTAALPAPPEAEPEPARSDPARSLRQRLLVSTALTVPVVAMAMVPALQFDYWQWLSLTLAAPVVVWGGAPFHRAAWTNLRHGAATMDTLVSLGTLAAFAWSLYALFLGTAGDAGHDAPVRADRRAAATAARTSTSRPPPG